MDVQGCTENENQATVVESGGGWMMVATRIMDEWMKHGWKDGNARHSQHLTLRSREDWVMMMGGEGEVKDGRPSGLGSRHRTINQHACDVDGGPFSDAAGPLAPQHGPPLGGLPARLRVDVPRGA